MADAMAMNSDSGSEANSEIDEAKLEELRLAKIEAYVLNFVQVSISFYVVLTLLFTFFDSFCFMKRKIVW